MLDQATSRDGSCPVRILLGIAALACVGWLLPAAASAQPFYAFASFDPGYPTNSSYIDIPASPALQPTSAFTFEAWVLLIADPSDCRSIAGTGYQTGWWVGVCTASGQPTLRTYLKGGQRNGGTVPLTTWTHIAVVFTGTQRLHYINGELVATFSESAPLTTNSANMRIGSDVDWAHTPTGFIDEVRVWNVARTQAQIRSTINVELNTPQPGLVAVWEFSGGPPLGTDSLGSHSGTAVGSGVFDAIYSGGSSCAGVASSTVLCLDNRFQVTTYYRTATAPGLVDGLAHVAVNSSGSGVLWFFSADNWEVMTKAINACPLNNRYWIYSAATTDRFYRMEVFDVVGRTQKIYFNYAGPPAPAVTDSDAFATCP